MAASPTKLQLREQLKDKGLKSTGTLQELLKRLAEPRLSDLRSQGTWLESKDKKGACIKVRDDLAPNGMRIARYNGDKLYYLKQASPIPPKKRKSPAEQDPSEPAPVKKPKYTESAGMTPQTEALPETGGTPQQLSVDGTNRIDPIIAVIPQLQLTEFRLTEQAAAFAQHLELVRADPGHAARMERYKGVDSLHQAFLDDYDF